MDEESRSGVLQGLRRYQDLLRQFSEADAQDQLAGAASAEAPRNDNLPGGHLQDPSVRALEAFFNKLFLQDADEPAHDDDGSFADSDDDCGDGDDGSFADSDDDGGDGGGELTPDSIIRFTEMLDQGLREESYNFLSQWVEPDVLEQVREIAEFTLGLAEGEDALERLCEAVADGRLFAPPAQATPARLDGGESYGGFRGVPASSAAVASLEKQKFHDLGDGRNECPICLKDYASGDDISVMPCTYRHRYHQECLAAWLERNHLCPLCRHALPTEEQEEGIKRTQDIMQLGPNQQH